MKRTENITLLLAVPLLAGALVGTQFKKPQTVEAYNKTKLPTTICLDDYAEKDIRDYYSALNSKDESERKGNNLLKNLKPILKNNQNYFSYDISNGVDIWKMYEITDRDWVKSPAKDIEGYNEATNTITNYKYGSSTANKGSNPFIHALYVNRDADNKVRAWATEAGESSHGGNAEWCIDREHIWPKSHGFEEDSEERKGLPDYDDATSGARGDPMHLWAGDSYVNSALHNNNFYGYVDKNRAYTDGKDTYTYASGNLLGYSKTFGGNVSVFEPQDSDKGDIARAVFYMVARYNDLAGDDVIENDNPNLELTNDLSVWQKSGYISTSSTTGKMGVAKDLLEWNKLDPVDGWELHRNNLLHRNFTNNRNPFIDFPEWADYIWGENTENKYANPLTDKIAEPKDFVPQSGGDTKDDGLIFGLPKLYVFIGAGVLGVIVLIVVIVIMTKGSKKQKKALKKVGKKVIKSATKSKK